MGVVGVSPILTFYFQNVHIVQHCKNKVTEQTLRIFKFTLVKYDKKISKIYNIYILRNNLIKEGQFKGYLTH